MTTSPLVLRRPRSYEATLALALGAFYVVLAFAAPRFFTLANLAALARNSSVLLILSMGMLIVILTGGIDISVASTLAATSVVLARTAAHGPAVAIALTLLVGAAAGAVNACFIAEFDLPPIVTTLATLGIYRGLLLQWTGGEWVTNLSGWVGALGRIYRHGFDLATLVAAAVALGTWLALRGSTWGRNVYRLGGSPLAAARTGVSRRRVIYSAYVLMGLLTGLAAIFFAAQLGSVQGNAAVGYELTVIAAVVLGGARVAGGRGSVRGTLLGVLLLATIDAALILLGVPTFWHGIATGAMVLIGVAAGALQRRRIAHTTEALA